MIILSLNPLDAFDLLKVRNILRRERSPLKHLQLFERFTGFCDGKIFFDHAEQVWSDIAAKFKGKDFVQLVRELDSCPQIILTVI